MMDIAKSNRSLLKKSKYAASESKILPQINNSVTDRRQSKDHRTSIKIESPTQESTFMRSGRKKTINMLKQTAFVATGQLEERSHRNSATLSPGIARRESNLLSKPSFESGGNSKVGCEAVIEEN